MIYLPLHQFKAMISTSNKNVKYFSYFLSRWQRLMPISIHFGMFVIGRGEFFVFKYPTLVIYFDLRKSEFEFTFLLIRQNINFLLSFQKTAKKIFFSSQYLRRGSDDRKKREADWRILSCISWISFHGYLLAPFFSGTATGKQKYFFNHISFAEKMITGKQAIN